MDVKGGHVLVPHPAAAHIGLVGQDQGGGDGVHRVGGGVVVVADGSDDGGHVGGLHPHLVQDAEGHGGPAEGVVVAVDHVADVVHVGGDPGQLHLFRGVAQLGQDAGGHLGALGHVGEGVLRKAQRRERGVRLGDVGADLRRTPHHLKGNIHRVLLSSPPSHRQRDRSTLPSGRKGTPSPSSSRRWMPVPPNTSAGLRPPSRYRTR